MKTTTSKKVMYTMALLTAILIFVSCTKNRGVIEKPGITSNYDSVKTELEQLKKTIDPQTVGGQHADSALYNTINHLYWTPHHISHSPDIKVTWPDGEQTTGSLSYREKLKKMFVYAPETIILEHPVRVGSADKTAITGILTGTFTQPMPAGNGKKIKPTGKTFSIPIYAIGIWKNGMMTEEYLYWDHAILLKQLGIKQ